MTLRVALALTFGLLSAPAAAQQEIEGIISRVQAIPTSSTKADCDAQLAKAATANAFDLFYGSGVCNAAKQKPQSSFLLLAGQIRATPDMALMFPATQADAKTVIALYGFIYSYAGGMGDDEVLRDKASRTRLYALLDEWKPTFEANYNPGWATRRRPSEADYRAALAESALGRRRQVEEIAKLYSDALYYALHREERDLYARQGGPVEVGSAVATRMDELRRQMNERAVALGVPDMVVVDVNSAETELKAASRGMPPHTPASDEQIIDGANDPVAKRCADNAEFGALAQNARIARVLVTSTKEWGTVWRADLEGGGFGPERFVCSANSTSSRPIDMGQNDRISPLTESVPH